MVWPSQSQPPALTQTVRRTAVPDIHAATIIERDAMAALLVLMVRWFLAGVFLRAGVVKLGDSADFRAAVANYGLLPLRFVVPVAVVLPLAEIAGGALLATGILTAPAAILLGLLLAAFAVAIAVNLARGR